MMKGDHCRLSASTADSIDVAMTSYLLLFPIQWGKRLFQRKLTSCNIRPQFFSSWWSVPRPGARWLPWILWGRQEDTQLFNECSARSPGEMRQQCLRRQLLISHPPWQQPPDLDNYFGLSGWTSTPTFSFWRFCIECDQDANWKKNRLRNLPECKKAKLREDGPAPDWHSQRYHIDIWYH